MKQKICAVLVCFMVLMMTCSAFTATAESEQIGSNTVRVSGRAQSGQKDRKVAINVFAPGKGYADLYQSIQDNHANILVYHDEALTKAGGGFSFDMELSVGNGTYTAYISVEGEAIYTQTIRFIDAEGLKLLLGEINSAANSAKVLELISLYGKNLGFYQTYFDVNDTIVAEYLYHSVKRMPLNVNDRERAVAVYKLCAGMDAFFNQKVKDIFLYSDLYDLTHSDLNGWYEKPYFSDFARKRVTERLLEAKPDNVTDFTATMTEAFILSIVEQPDGVGNLKEVMDGFCSLIGMTPSANLQKYQNVMGNNYATLQRLKEAFVNGSETGSESSSGSSGSGSRGSSGSMTAQIDPVAIKTPETLPVTIFKDLDEASWAVEYIVKLSEQGILNGKENALFFPNEKITREEFTKLVVTAFLNTSPTAEIHFRDVPQDSWFYESVSKAFGAGVINGQSDTIFGAGEFVTREDLAVISCRASKFPVDQSGATSFFDDEEIADYAKSAVAALSENGIIVGQEEGLFQPKGLATRAQAAKIIYLLLQSI